MRRFLIIPAVMAALLATAVPAAAITGNYQIDEKHTFVGLLVTYDEDGEFAGRCSGTLISPSIFLTAGHCTDGADSALIYFDTYAGADYDPETELDPRTGYPEYCAEDIVCGSASTPSQLHNMGFDNFAGFPDIRDAGIVVLDEPVDLDRYASLAEANSLDRLATRRGRQDVTFTLSGYGLTSIVPRSESFRTRLMTTSRLVNLRNQLTGGFNLQTTANPGGGKGGACFGDSGGPVFYSSTETIVGVTSFGITPWCTGVDFTFRTDTTDVLAWIMGIATAAGEADEINVVSLP